MAKRIRVVHVLFSFGTGGLEKGIATVIRNGSPEFEHVIVCLTTSGESARLLPEGTRIVELHKSPGNSPVFLWKLSRTLRRLCPDVVHTRNWSGLDGVIAARLAGIRSVVHGEHGWGMDDPEGLNPKRVRIRRFLARWVREFTCVSRQMEQWLRVDIRVGKPIAQIYNGIDTNRYRPGPEGAEVRSALGIPDEVFVLGVVGRLDPIKDHPSLFRAFETLRNGGIYARLLVVGDGPERTRLESLAGDGISFLGDRGDVPQLMRAMDVFVLPSRNEGISNTVLEAMATGLPVVATAVGGNPELVIEGATGLLIAPGDATAIKQAVSFYANDPSSRELHGTNGRRRVVKNFSVASMVSRYEQVYRRVTATGRR